LSIAMVLGSHNVFAQGFPMEFAPLNDWIFDGKLGVRCFFLISGLLISWLMILECQQDGRVNLRHFYARRALRILPVYFGFLLTIALLQWFTPYTLDRTSWMGNLTFTRDFFGEDFTTGHLWSLSVEEQFYLLWPGIFVAFGMTRQRRWLWLLLLPVLVAPWSRALGRRPDLVFLGPVFQGDSFFSHFDLLAIGCACAVLLSRRYLEVEQWFRQRPNLALGAGLTLVVGAQVLQQLSRHSFALRVLVYSLGPTLQGFGMAILVVQSVVMPQWGVFRALSWWWMRRIGVLSYSLYIWQQLFCSKPETFGLGNVWWMSFPCWLGTVFVVAFVSYYGFERPFLKLRARFREIKPESATLA
jgi:peptidoglycan/LPS O-acetylase OafA/YrhL